MVFLPPVRVGPDLKGVPQVVQGTTFHITRKVQSSPLHHDVLAGALANFARQAPSILPLLALLSCQKQLDLLPQSLKNPSLLL